MDPISLRKQIAADATDALHSELVEATASPFIYESVSKIEVDLFQYLISDGIVLLPREKQVFEGQRLVLYSAEAIEFAKTLREQSIRVSLIPTPDEYIYEGSASVIVPAIMISAPFIVEHRESIQILFGVISNLVTKALAGAGEAKSACELEVNVVHADRTRIQVQYQGPVSGISELEKIVRRASEKKS
ncbi:MAG: hypothetical protein ACK5XS_12660 [Armatimonadota bacterium]|jgi:hypothetical protein|nr:hypothetical protein [Fimbriimonadaceae bacterium]MCZ8139329.1 hypothetical protein [Fimbriimonadaceae bacterium]